jgi:hypothetical protein
MTVALSTNGNTQKARAKKQKTHKNGNKVEKENK